MVLGGFSMFDIWVKSESLYNGIFGFLICRAPYDAHRYRIAMKRMIDK